MAAGTPPDSYRIRCPHCEAGHRCSSRHFGKRVTCSKCGHQFRIPELSPQPSPPPPPPPVAAPIIRRHESEPEASQPTRSNFDFANREPPRPREPKAKLTRADLFIRALIGIYACCLLLTMLGMAGSAIENDPSDSPLRNPAFGIVQLVFAPILMTGMLLVYVAPTAVAYVRDHQNVMPILVLNLFFGWTMLGWVVCLAWAFTSDVKETRQFIRKVVVHEDGGTA